MTEYEKMLAGEPFSVRDPEVNASKLRAVEGCQKLNSIPVTEEKEKEKAIRELFGSCGKELSVSPHVPFRTKAASTPSVTLVYLNTIELRH